MSKLPIVWTQHLKDKEAKDKFEQTLRHTTLVLTRLQDVIYSYKAGMDRADNSLDQFDQPAWPYRQAWANGKRAAFDDILRLLEFLDDG